jgi:cytochrome c oxidase cbb3-type subunit 3
VNLKTVSLFAPVVLVTLTIAVAQEPQAPPTSSPPPAAARRGGFAQTFFGLGAPPDPAAVDRGQKLFVGNCGFCHGTNATGGNSGPDLVHSVLVLHDDGTGKEIGPVILNGRPAQGMPKFAFTDAQIKDLAAFFLSRSQAVANRMEYKILNVVTGNPDAGHAYFDAHCATCHSATGDLAHIAGKFEPSALQSRFLYPVTNRYPGQPGPPPDPKAQVTATVTMPNGQTVSGRLLTQDDFSITVLDANGQRQTIPLDDSGLTKVEIHDPLLGHEQLLKQYKDADMHNILAYLETLK